MNLIKNIITLISGSKSQKFDANVARVADTIVACTIKLFFDIGLARQRNLVYLEVYTSENNNIVCTGNISQDTGLWMPFSLGGVVWFTEFRSTGMYYDIVVFVLLSLGHHYIAPS